MCQVFGYLIDSVHVNNYEERKLLPGVCLEKNKCIWKMFSNYNSDKVLYGSFLHENILLINFGYWKYKKHRISFRICLQRKVFSQTIILTWPKEYCTIPASEFADLVSNFRWSASAACCTNLCNNFKMCSSLSRQSTCSRR